MMIKIEIMPYLFICLISCFSQDKPAGYPFDQAFAEATLPPFYSRVVEDLGLTRAQQTAIETETKRLNRTFMTQWEWLRETEDVKNHIIQSLNEKQAERLDELKMQYDGALYSLIRPAVQKKLALGTFQKKKIEEFFIQFNEIQRTISQKDKDGNWNWREHEKKVFLLKAEYDDKILSLLTDEQKGKYKKLGGKRIGPEPRHWIGLF